MQTSAEKVEPTARNNVLGVAVSAINMDMALAQITQALEKKEKGYICVTGVHGVSEAQTDAEFREILNRSFLCTPDGMPLVWVGRLQGQKHMGRVYGPDVMLAVMSLSEQKGWRHFFYGGANGTAEALQEKLVEQISKTPSGGDISASVSAVERGGAGGIAGNNSPPRPDAIWVGLSTPKQERFMAEYLPKLDMTLMFGVGAAFDFHAGKVRQAPRWMQRSGLEWLFRLCSEPRRLWKRYLKNNPLFLVRIFLPVHRIEEISDIRLTALCL